MKLSTLLRYKSICIQCHDNPDADALASAYGLHLYFQANHIESYIVYGGRNQITKPNLKLMIRELDIPVSFFPETFHIKDGLLLTVDCQPGESNVTMIRAENTACIDHHQICTQLEMSDIRTYLGSCSTLVWKLLLDEGFNVADNPKLCTALYYGLMTDTGNFIESLHPLDRDMKDSLVFDKNLVTRFINSNISIKELEIAGIALIRHIYNDDHRFAVVHSEACDPNILGLISDLVLQVDKIDTCIVYSKVDSGYKISVRSCIKEVRANELADYLTHKIGSGGGHTDKAGGFIFDSLYESLYPTINTETYFGLRMTEYFDSIDILYAKDYSANLSETSLYKKLPTPVGVVNPSEFLPMGANIIIRSLEKDTEAKVDDDFLILIGINGEVYPIRKKQFEDSYTVSDEPFIYEANYSPTIRTNIDDRVFVLERYAKTCIPKDDVYVHGKELDRTVKVFTLWDEEQYVLGNPGDYLVCKQDNPKDIYIIPKKTFDLSYILVKR